MYSPEDIAVLRDAAKMVAAGHTISEVARLPAAQLAQAAAQLAPLPADDAAVGGDDGGGAYHDDEDDGAATDDSGVKGQQPQPSGKAAIDSALVAALQAIARFDRQQFEAALFPVTTMAGLGPVALCESVLLPLLRQIGDRWENGSLSVAAEHFGSALCRAKILQCLEFVARSAAGPRMVCACPENELHEGGLLAFAVRAATAQWQVIYLGAHTPLQDALDTAVRIAADLVALSLTVPRTPDELAAYSFAVAEAKRARPSLRVIAGGREATAQRMELEAAGIAVPADIATAIPVPGVSNLADKTSAR